MAQEAVELHEEWCTEAVAEDTTQVTVAQLEEDPTINLRANYKIHYTNADNGTIKVITGGFNNENDAGGAHYDAHSDNWKITNPMNKPMLTRINDRMTNGGMMLKLILHQPIRHGANTLERKARVPRGSSPRELVTISRKG